MDYKELLPFYLIKVINEFMSFLLNLRSSFSWFLCFSKESKKAICQPCLPLIKKTNNVLQPYMKSNLPSLSHNICQMLFKEACKTLVETIHVHDKAK